MIITIRVFSYWNSCKVNFVFVKLINSSCIGKVKCIISFKVFSKPLQILPCFVFYIYLFILIFLPRSFVKIMFTLLNFFFPNFILLIFWTCFIDKLICTRCKLWTDLLFNINALTIATWKHVLTFILTAFNLLTTSRKLKVLYFFIRNIFSLIICDWIGILANWIRFLWFVLKCTCSASQKHMFPFNNWLPLIYLCIECLSLRICHIISKRDSTFGILWLLFNFL